MVVLAVSVVLLVALEELAVALMMVGAGIVFLSVSKVGSSRRGNLLPLASRV